MAKVTVASLNERVTELEETTLEFADGMNRITALETVIENLKIAVSGGKVKTRKKRKTREYSDEERAAIRERLKAGKEAAQARRAAEAAEAEEDDEGDEDFEDEEEEATAPAPRRRRRVKVAEE